MNENLRDTEKTLNESKGIIDFDITGMVEGFEPIEENPVDDPVKTPPERRSAIDVLSGIDVMGDIDRERSVAKGVSTEELEENMGNKRFHTGETLGSFQGDRWRGYIDNPNPRVHSDLDRTAAYRQGFFDMATKEALKGGAGAVLTFGELAGHVLDVTKWAQYWQEGLNKIDAIDKEFRFDAFDNSVSQAFREAREHMNQDSWLKTFRKRPDALMDFKDPTFYAQSLSGIVQSIGGFAGVGFGAGLAFRGLAGLTQRGLKAAFSPGSVLTGSGMVGATNTLGQIGTAISLGYGEGRLRSQEVADMVYEKAFNQRLEEGKRPTEARKEALQMASKSAAHTLFWNASIVPFLNYLTVSPLFKHNYSLGSHSRGRFSYKATDGNPTRWLSRVQDMAPKDIMPNRFVEYGRESLFEFIQELGGVWSQDEGLYMAREELGHYEESLTIGERFVESIFTEEAMFEGTLGAIGGFGNFALMQNIPVHRDADGNRISGANREMQELTRVFNQYKEGLVDGIKKHIENKKNFEEVVNNPDSSESEVEAAMDELFQESTQRSIIDGSAYQISLMLEQEVEDIEGIINTPSEEIAEARIEALNQLREMTDGTDINMEAESKLEQINASEQLTDQQKAEARGLINRLADIEEMQVMKELGEDTLRQKVNKAKAFQQDVQQRWKKYEEFKSKYDYKDEDLEYDIPTKMWQFWDNARTADRQVDLLSNHTKGKEELREENPELAQDFDMYEQLESLQFEETVYNVVSQIIQRKQDELGIENIQELSIGDVIDIKLDTMEELRTIFEGDQRALDFLDTIESRQGQQLTDQLRGLEMTVDNFLQSREDRVAAIQRTVNQIRDTLVEGDKVDGQGKPIGEFKNFMDQVQQIDIVPYMILMNQQRSKINKEQLRQIESAKGRSDLIDRANEAIARAEEKAMEQYRANLNSITDMSRLEEMKEDAAKHEQTELLDLIVDRIETLKNKNRKESKKQRTETPPPPQEPTEIDPNTSDELPFDNIEQTPPEEGVRSELEQTPPQEDVGLPQTPPQEPTDIPQTPPDDLGARELGERSLRNDIESAIRDSEQQDNPIEYLNNELEQLRDYWKSIDTEISNQKIDDIIDSELTREEDATVSEESTFIEGPTMSLEDALSPLEEVDTYESKFDAVKSIYAMTYQAQDHHKGTTRRKGLNPKSPQNPYPELHLPQHAKKGDTVTFFVEKSELLKENQDEVKIEVQLDGETIGYIRDPSRVVYADNIPDDGNTYLPIQGDGDNAQLRNSLRKFRSQIIEGAQKNVELSSTIEQKTLGHVLHNWKVDDAGNILTISGERVFNDEGVKIEGRDPHIELQSIEALGEDATLVFLSGTDFVDINNKPVETARSFDYEKVSENQGMVFIALPTPNGKVLPLEVTIPTIDEAGLLDATMEMLDQLVQGEMQGVDVVDHISKYIYTRQHSKEAFNDAKLKPGTPIVTKVENGNIYIGEAGSSVIYTNDTTGVQRHATHRHLKDNLDAVRDILSNARFNIDRSYSKTSTQIPTLTEDGNLTFQTYDNYGDFIRQNIKTDIFRDTVDDQSVFFANPVIYLSQEFTEVTPKPVERNKREPDVSEDSVTRDTSREAIAKILASNNYFVDNFESTLENNYEIQADIQTALIRSNKEQVLEAIERTNTDRLQEGVINTVNKVKAVAEGKDSFGPQDLNARMEAVINFLELSSPTFQDVARYYGIQISEGNFDISLESNIAVTQALLKEHAIDRSEIATLLESDQDVTGLVRAFKEAFPEIPKNYNRNHLRNWIRDNYGSPKTEGTKTTTPTTPDPTPDEQRAIEEERAVYTDEQTLGRETPADGTLAEAYKKFINEVPQALKDRIGQFNKITGLQAERIFRDNNASDPVFSKDPGDVADPVEYWLVGDKIIPAPKSKGFHEFGTTNTNTPVDFGVTAEQAAQDPSSITPISLSEITGQEGSGQDQGSARTPDFTDTREMSLEQVIEKEVRDGMSISDATITRQRIALHILDMTEAEISKVKERLEEIKKEINKQESEDTEIKEAKKEFDKFGNQIVQKETGLEPHPRGMRAKAIIDSKKQIYDDKRLVITRINSLLNELSKKGRDSLIDSYKLEEFTGETLKQTEEATQETQRSEIEQDPDFDMDSFIADNDLGDVLGKPATKEADTVINVRIDETIDHASLVEQQVKQGKLSYRCKL